MKFWGGEIAWATPRDLSSLEVSTIAKTERTITDEGVRKSSAEVLPINSVLFSSRAPIGLVAINTIPMATNQGFKSFVPNPDQLEAKYLYWWLRSKRAWLNNLGVGATFKEVSKEIVSRVEIPLPSLDEQRRIADILDKADVLRVKRREAIAHLDLLGQSVFHEMFGDVVSNSLGWDIKAFSEVASSRLGKMLDKKVQTGRSSFPYLRNANVRWFGFKLDDLLEMDFSAEDRVEFKLQPGDVLVCEGGEPGRAAIWKGEIQDCYFQKALHRVRPDNRLLLPEYLVHFLWHTAKAGGFAGYVTTATIAHLTGEKLKSMRIAIPPLERQQAFAGIANNIQRNRMDQTIHLEQLNALFSSLQDRAFKGEL